MGKLAKKSVAEQEKILRHKKGKVTLEGWLAALEEEESVFPEELYSR